MSTTTALLILALAIFVSIVAAADRRNASVRYAARGTYGYVGLACVIVLVVGAVAIASWGGR